MTSLWHIWIASITTPMFWGHCELNLGWLDHQHCHTSILDLITQGGTNYQVGASTAWKHWTKGMSWFQVSWDFIMLLSTTHDLNFWVVYCWNFPCNIFRLKLTLDTETTEHKTAVWGTAVCKIRPQKILLICFPWSP